jgi:competence protein ComEC
METEYREIDCQIKVFDLNRRETERVGYPPGNPADGFLIRYRNGQRKWNILLDGGKKGHGEKIIRPYLREVGIRKLDMVFISHMHFDHFGGFIDLLSDPYIEVEQLIYAPVSEDTISRGDRSGISPRLWEELKAVMKERNVKEVKITEEDVGCRITLDDLFSFTIVATPIKRWEEDPGELNINDFNLILKMEFNAFSALFTGDCATKQAETILRSPMEQTIRDITLLKAAHHGGDESTTVEFIRRCNPKLVLIPCNWLVVEERPSFIQNLHEFTRHGAKIFRSDQCQDIDVYTDGRSICCLARTQDYTEKVLFESL